MLVKDLKELIKDMPDDRRVIISTWDYSKCETILRYTHQCCNTERQEELNEVWLSGEGLRKDNPFINKKGQSTLEYLLCMSIIILACIITVPKVVKSYNNSLSTVTNSMIDSSNTVNY